MLSRLDDRFALLISGRRTALPKHRTLRATLDWSYDLLSVPERLLLQRLAIFAAPFSLEAAGAVTGNGGGLTAEIADGIENLVGKSMVTADLSGVIVHYRLLETTKAFALERLMEGEGSRQLAQRHAEYYQRFLERIEDEQGIGSANLSDLGNVRAALEWCFAPYGDSAIGVRLAVAAAPAFLAMSLMTECQRWCEQALLTLEDTTRGGREEMQLQAALGISLLFGRGANEAARVAMSRGLAIAEAQEDARTQIRLLGPLSIFYVRLGDFNTAMRYSKRASAISKIITDPDAIAFAHCCVGFSLLHSGDLSGARVELEATTENQPRSQRDSIRYSGFDHYSLAGVHLARTLSLQGYQTRAAEYARQVIRHAASLNHPVSLSITLHWAISVFLLAGDLASAEEHTDWLISRAESHSLVPYTAIGHGFKGELAVRRGDAATGVEILQRCLVDLQAMHHELVITPFSISLALGLAAIGQFAEGGALIDERIRLVAINGNFGYLPELLRAKGGVILATPNPDGDAAEKCFMQSLELSRRQGALAWELRTAVDLAALFASRGQVDSVRTLLRPLLNQFVEGFDTPDLKAAERLLVAGG